MKIGDKIRIIGALLSSVATYFITKRVSNKKMYSKREDDKVRWIDGEDDSNEDKTSHEFLRPKFRIGEEVIIVSPYTGDSFMFDDGMEPEYFTVNAHKFDANDGAFRYRMEESGPLWYAEDWIEKPIAPCLGTIYEGNEDGDGGKDVGKEGDKDAEDKEEPPKLLPNDLFITFDMNGLHMSDGDFEPPIEYDPSDGSMSAEQISDAMDDMARTHSVNRYLDKMNSGTAEEFEESLRKLREMSERGEI